MTKLRLPISRKEPLRLGFLPSTDCAPLVYAHERGLFQRHDLEVELQRESSWSAIRDKVTNGDLDGAHAPATLPFLANVGVDADPCSCVSGVVLSLQGNAITLSRQLQDQGVCDALTLREQIYRQWGKRTLTFGVVFPYSPAALLLRQWFQSAGIKPESEVRIAVAAPEQMFPLLKMGYLDGFAVEEPWASVAVQAGVGSTVSDSAALAPHHPEKVLVVRHSFAIGRADDHERLVAALLEACAFCDQPENAGFLGDLLAQPCYVNAPAECIRAGLPRAPALTEVSTAAAPVSVFHTAHANEPADKQAAWIMDRLYELIGQNPFMPTNDRTPVLKNVFRQDVYVRALALLPDMQPSTRPAPAGR